jgi:hypothetical protein
MLIIHRKTKTVFATSAGADLRAVVDDTGDLFVQSNASVLVGRQRDECVPSNTGNT